MKKKFFEIPLEIIEIKVPIYVSELENALGKTLILDLTKFLKGKNCEAKFIIKKRKNEVIGEFKSLKLLPFYIKRLVRRNTSSIEDSFVVKAKDAEFKIKPLFLTRKKVHRSVKKSIRNKAKEMIKNFIQNSTREKIFSDVLSSKLQRTLNTKLRKIYPLAFCDIRMIIAKEKPKKEKEKLKVEKIKITE